MKPTLFIFLLTLIGFVACNEGIENTSTQKKVSPGNNKDIKEIINILKKIRSKITDQTNVLYSEYDDVKELQTEMDKDIANLEKGNLKSLEKYKVFFLPTSTFQEIATTNGWGTEYLKYARNFDLIYEKIYNKN